MKDAILTLKQTPNHHSEIAITETLNIGGSDIITIAGPCAIESRELLETTAAHLQGKGVQMLRGGAYKPRTSPYSFQGLGVEGLDIMQTVGQRYDMPVVTEVMSIEQIPLVCDRADMLQVGSRNMQNYDLLKALGAVSKPILLKRGLAATLEEFVMAAEYIASHGNPNIVLCERGIRSFDSYTRNVLDLGAVAALKNLTHLPVVVDPSHAAGRRELVADLARAAIACGADGLIVECHPVPDESISDAKQALSLDDMVDLIDSLKPIAAAVGRSISTAPQLIPVAA